MQVNEGWWRAPLGTLIALGLVIAWDASGLDLRAAALFGSASGFAWRSNAWLFYGLHEIPRLGSWLLVAGLFVCARWPIGPMAAISRAERLWLAFTVLLGVLVVSLIKHSSATSCPWDLEQFGGVARHVSHWAWGEADGGPGHCFPAGHASAAFAWMAGYFAFQRRAPRIAGIWLALAAIAGLLLGFTQQVRGAHFMSHTLWTAWICWTVSLVSHRVFEAWRGQRWLRTPGIGHA